MKCWKLSDFKSSCLNNRLIARLKNLLVIKAAKVLTKVNKRNAPG